MQPDWKDIKSYDHMKSYSLCDWGWEFIRRDQRYIDEWESEFSEFENSENKGHFSFDSLLVNEFDYLIETQNFDEYTKLIKETSRVDSHDVYKFIIPSKNASEWGLRHYQNPASKKINQLNLIQSKIINFEQSCNNGEVFNAIEIKKEENNLLAVINLEKPIKSQMDKIEKQAKDLQARDEKVSENNVRLWIEYLRCIDAKKSGVKRKEASKTLFPYAEPSSERKWDNTMQQINGIMNSKYTKFMRENSAQ